MPLIIGLCGRAGSGKTSVAKHLVDHYGFTKISFADPLKKMAKDMFGFSDEQVYGDATIKERKDPFWPTTPRNMMQKLGQAARDHLGPSIWIDSLFGSIVARHQKFVIEDVRYRNEVLAIRQRKHFVWRLHCSDSISSDAGTHPSEAEVDSIENHLIACEFYSTRDQGLPHLFSLVDNEMARLIRARDALPL